MGPVCTLTLGPDRTLIDTLTALHDVGKAMTSFQALDVEAAGAVGHPGPLRGCFPYDREKWGHDAAGWAMLDALRERGMDDGGDAGGLPAEALAPDAADAFRTLVGATVAGHHGRPRGTTLYWDQFKSHARQRADVDAAAHLVNVVTQLFGWHSGFPSGAAAARASYLLAGLITLADWLASLDGGFAPIATDMPAEDYLDRHARPAAAKLLDDLALALFAPREAAPAMAFDQLFPGFVPTPMQKECERAMDGLVGAPTEPMPCCSASRLPAWRPTQHVSREQPNRAAGRVLPTIACMARRKCTTRPTDRSTWTPSQKRSLRWSRVLG